MRHLACGIHAVLRMMTVRWVLKSPIHEALVTGDSAGWWLATLPHMSSSDVMGNRSFDPLEYAVSDQEKRAA